ncbi:hypothetical protein GPECTOR_40g509 [Gonium pectorale]|uniref:Guanylate cyclase domain-containing protein n=1 Tax=Gonium pectorale TaxID=33097 RepID=A0A150GB16_GONPE|nr:hypothetical protein GPECTOR_40g509 [Gonium pectorale]|eukprot:KXZ46775.1 hypothetical protein GPECTOR_40g509 [Gonium pectorale]
MMNRKGSALLPLQDLIRVPEACTDPVAIVTLDRTTRRAVRTQRISNNLVLDVNLEALYAGWAGNMGHGASGVSVAGGSRAGPVPGIGSADVEDLEPSSGVSAHGVPAMLQGAYYKAESLRFAAHHVNDTLGSLLGCSGPSEYEGLLADMLGSEPLLRAILHDCCICMMDGASVPTTQIMVHHPIPGSPTRMVLPITIQPVPVLIRSLPPLPSPLGLPPSAVVDGGGAAGNAAGIGGAGVAGVALAIRYNLSAGLRATLQQMHRVYAMLSGLPGIVTLFTMRGRVLYQNTASIRYMGLRQDTGLMDGLASTHPDHARDSRGLSVCSILRQMFALAGDQLDEMLEEAAMGKTWKGIARVPPLLTPASDPGPAPEGVLGRGLTFVSSNSQAPMLTTWERLATGLTSTQAGVAVVGSHTGHQPSDPDVGDLAKVLLTNTTNDGRSTERNALVASSTTAGMAPDLARIKSVMQITGSTGGITSRAGGAVGGTSAGGAGAGGMPVPGRLAGGLGGGSGSTADSALFLAMGSTAGSSILRSRQGTAQPQDSTSRSRFRGHLPGGPSEAETAEAGSSNSANMSAATIPASLPDRLIAPPPRFGSSAPVVHATPGGAFSRVISGIRNSNAQLLDTLMENGGAVGGFSGGGGEGVVSGANLGGARASVGAGSSVGGPDNANRAQSEYRLTEATRRSIVRRRSALKLALTDADPLSTSTWGLLDGARRRPESKSFSVRQNTSNLPGIGPFTRHGMEMAAGVGGLPADAASSSVPSSTANSSNSKRRAPSRLMSFLASRNLNGSHSAGPSRNNVFSSPAVEGGGSGGLLGADRKAISSASNPLNAGGSDAFKRSSLSASVGATAAAALPEEPAAPVAAQAGLPSPSATGLPSPLGPRPPLFAPFGGAPSPSQSQSQTPFSIAAVAAGGPGAAADAGGAGAPRIRRPPGRRVVRPTVEDVAEESGNERSSRLHLAGHSTQGGPGSRADTAAQLATFAYLAASQAGGANGSQMPNFPSNGPASAAALATLGSLRGFINGTQSQLPDLGMIASCNASQAPPQGGDAARASHATRTSNNDDDDECWHEVTAVTLRDPVLGEQALMVMQVDVTARVKAEQRIAEVLEAEHKLLESVFPRHVLEAAAGQATRQGQQGRSQVAGARANKFNLAVGLAENCHSVATYHPMVTILFSDIIGFTNMCHEIPATKVMEFLNNLYSRLDTLLDVYGVYKVETIGDCYMVAGGLMTRDADGFMTVRGSDSLDELHAEKVMSFAKAMLRETAQVMLPTTGKPVQMRIGLHSGPVMSGIVGSRMPRFCLFGDTVNTASRMESTCPPGCIHVSSSTAACLPHDEWEPTGGVQVKGKGLMETYRWVPPDPELNAQGSGTNGRGRLRRVSSVAYLQSGPSSSRDLGGPFYPGGGPPADLPGGGGDDSSHRRRPSLSPTQGPPAASALLRSGGSGASAGAGPGTPGSMSIVSGPQGAVEGAALTALGARPMSAIAGYPHVSGFDRVSAVSTEKGSSSGRVVLPTAGAGSGGTMSGPSKTTRRKPHRSCSTTAMAYKGLGKAL